MLIVWSLCIIQRETSVSLREVFLRHRTYHTTSWCHRIAFAWPPVSCWRTIHIFVWPSCEMLAIQDVYTMAARSRVTFLTQLVNFVFPPCMVREPSCSLLQPLRSLRLKIILLPSSGVTSREIKKNHLRVSIASQNRDSVTRALRKFATSWKIVNT